MWKWLLLLSLAACCKSPLVTGQKADENKYLLMQISLGMDAEKILCIMGYPYRAEALVSVEDQTYEVWYYLTEKTTLGQTQLTAYNLTPLFFLDGVLKGWGYTYYKYLTGDKRLREEMEYLKRTKYNQQNEGRPQSYNGVVPPPAEEAAPAQGQATPQNPPAQGASKQPTPQTQKVQTPPAQQNIQPPKAQNPPAQGK